MMMKMMMVMTMNLFLFSIDRSEPEATSRNQKHRNRCLPYTRRRPRCERPAKKCQNVPEHLRRARGDSITCNNNHHLENKSWMP